MKKVTVTVLPYGKRVKARIGDSVLDLLRKANIEVTSYCGGAGTCGKCKVKIVNGESISPLTQEEKNLLTEEELKSGYRLSCRTKVLKNTTIYVPDESLVEEEIREKGRFEIKTPLMPSVKCFRVSVVQPSLEDLRSDIERIKDILKSVYGIHVSLIDPLSLTYAPEFIRKKNWNFNVLVRNENEILGFKPVDEDKIYGLAIDIGTTTIGMYIVDLKNGNVVSSGSILNPQVKFGEDVISRLGYILRNGERGLRELNKVLIEGLNSLIEKLSARANISTQDIVDVVACGNTLMHHIFLNINPLSLASSPFVPHLSSPFDVKARELGLNVLRTAYVHTLPIEAGFVGADNVAVMISLFPKLSGGPYLVIDIGTNGEIVCGNKDRLLSASCATGPALEGATITHGMRAQLGAIERVWIEKGSYKVSYKVIGNVKPRGICGSGIIDAVSELFRSGLISHSGRFVQDKRCERLRRREKTVEFVIAWGEDTATGKDIAITQKDIRSVQLAKAALYAGAKILVNRLGKGKPKRVYLAGSFGNYIDIKSAYILGMFPYCSIEDIVAKGNLAGLGSCMALLNRKKREEAEKYAKRVRYVELAATEEFDKEFLDALSFPHARDSFPDLKKLLL
jgi:uncharacterized 2Fe-2S/4Fe-4S cluster protein (DUF4445 family)